jgi:uncharacterized protein DUF3352
LPPATSRALTSHTRHRAPAPRPHIAGAVLLVAIAAAMAGCGSSHGSGTSADPAGAVPASAPLYAGATVRPGGSEKAAALAAGRSLTHQSDPYLRLVQLLQTPGSPALSFKRDVAGWLGPQAGIFLSSLSSSSRSESAVLLSLLQQGLLGGSSTAGGFPFGAGGAQGAIVLDTSDVAKARSFLDSQAAHAGARARSYRGVSYKATATGVAFGVVSRFAVIGSESGLRGVVDTTLGAAPLARASGYAKLLSGAPSSAIAHLYSNPATAVRGAPPGRAGLMQLLAGAREANISLVPSSSSVAIDADLLASAQTSNQPPAGAGGLLASGADGAQALSELPADSWLAFGLGHVGATLAEDVQGLKVLVSLGSTLAGSGEASAAAPLNLGSLFEALLTPLGVLAGNSAEARRDFASWMGSGGIFASGASLLELKGAVVITSTNPALSRAAVPKLAAQLRKAGGSVQPVSIAGTDAAVGVRLKGLPLMLDIANGRDSSGKTKFVLGLGEASVTTALSPPGTLSGAPSAKAAEAALGEGIRPNLLIDFPTLLSLLEGVGLTEDPTLSKAVPYLKSLTALAGGTRGLGGGVERVRVTVGLR